MELYEVLLGVDRAARDTGQRITMAVRERNPVSAAVKAEQLADSALPHPEVEYTHAMRVTPILQPVPAAAMPVALAA